MLDPETARQVRWRHAINPQPVQPISNMQMRMNDYRAELRRFLFTDFLGMAAIGAAVVFPGVYWLTTAYPTSDAAALPWWLAAVVLWLGLLGPPFFVFKPERPSERDMLADIALRRQVGMDESVAP